MANAEYTERIDRVIDHVQAHLDQPLKLKQLAKIAYFSEFHFHRVFRAVTGETLKVFTNRLRVERAARLLRSSGRNATDIALECGFSSSATFSRAFRATYDTSPSAFRKSGEIKKSKIRKALLDESKYLLPMSDAEKRKAFPVEMVDMPKRNVAFIRVVDTRNPQRVIGAFEKMTTWARANDLADGTLFGMSLDDPGVTPQHLYRYDVCLATERAFRGKAKMLMPAMRYAVLRVTGDIKRVATAWDYLFSGWLINSKYEPEHAPALEVFNDMDKATDWSHFDLALCLPVKRL